jgi:hypothetical protein
MRNSRLFLSALAVLVIAAVGCGGEDDGSTDAGVNQNHDPTPDPTKHPDGNVDDFIGGYVVAGTLTVTVAGESPDPIPLDDVNIEISKTSSGGLTIGLEQLIKGCSLAAKVTGSTTFSVSPAACAVDIDRCDGGAGKMTFSFSASTGTVAQKALSWSSKGSVGIKCASGKTGSFPFALELKSKKS